MKEWDYGFIIGKIKVLENFILKMPFYERLASAENEEDFVVVLKESIYSKYEADGFYRMMELSEVDDRYMFESYLPERWGYELLYVRYDFQNLKVAIKSYILNRDVVIGKTGIYPEGFFIELVKGGMKEPEYMYETFKRAVEVYYESGDVVLMENSIDRDMYMYLLNSFPLSVNMKGVLSVEVDLFNISNILRYHYVEGRGLPMEFIVEGGTLNTKFYRDVLKVEMDELPVVFSGTPYQKVVSDSVEAVRRKSFGRVRRILNEYLLGYLRRFIYIPSGFEPVYRYYMLKELERANLKRIYTGIRSGMDKNRIMEGVVNVG